MKRRLVAGFCLLLLVVFASACQTKSDPSKSAPPKENRIDIRRGKTPQIDGVHSPSEWDDAGSIEVTVAPEWKAKIFYKHDGSHLYFMFSGVKGPGGAERFPDILLDMDQDRSAEWKPDDWWIHASYRDCEGHGKPNLWDSCAPQKDGWVANNYPLKDGAVIEVQIDYAKVGLTPGKKQFGIAFNLTDTQKLHALWPSAANQAVPSTWGEAISGDGWK